MKKISKIALVFSDTRKTDGALKRVSQVIESSCCKIIHSVNIKKLKNLDTKKIKEVQLILVLGGDGTMIGSIRHLHHLNIPFLGVNTGTVGFLTDLSIKNIEKLKEILNGS